MRGEESGDAFGIGAVRAIGKSDEVWLFSAKTHHPEVTRACEAIHPVSSWPSNGRIANFENLTRQLTMSLFRAIPTAKWACAKCADTLLGKRVLTLKPRSFSSNMAAGTKATPPVLQTSGARGPGRQAPNIRDQYKAKNTSGLYYTLRSVVTCLEVVRLGYDA